MKRYKSIFLLIIVALIVALAYGIKKSYEAKAISDEVNKLLEVKGGDFTLKDHDGNKISLQDFRGKAVLLFFGYTYCPDVCPTTLSDLNTVMKKLGESSKKVQVLYVTVDPERDKPERLKEYIGYFNSDFIGLWGKKEAIDKVTEIYYAPYHMQKPDESGDYLVWHSTTTFLIDKEGKFRQRLKYKMPPDEIKAAIEKIIAE